MIARGNRFLVRLWSAEGIVIAAALIQGLVVARAFGPDLYGAYALTMGFAAFVFLALDPRSGDLVVRYLAQFREQDGRRSRAIVRAGLTLDVLWGVGALLLVSALAYPVSGALQVSQHAALLPVAALGLAVAAPAATSKAVLGYLDHFSVIANGQVVIALTRAATVCGVAIAGGGLGGVLWTWTVMSVLESGLFLTAALRLSRRELGGSVWEASWSELRGRRREMARFLGYSSATALVSSAHKQVDVLVLGAIAGPTEAGYYRLAKSISAPAGNVGAPVQTVLLPRLARLPASSEQMRALVRRTWLHTELPLAFLALASLPLVPLVVRLLAGTEFAAAASPLAAFVVATAVAFATLHVRPLFLVRNEMRALLTFMTIIATVSIALFVPAAHLEGSQGVAWVRVGVLACGSLAMALYVGSCRQRRRLLRDDV